jgi:hypothetical protein
MWIKPLRPVIVDPIKFKEYNWGNSGNPGWIPRGFIKNHLRTGCLAGFVFSRLAAAKMPLGEGCRPVVQVGNVTPLLTNAD